MPLSIKDPEADRLARALSKRTGETLTEAIVVALRERLARTVRAQQTSQRAADIRAIVGRFHALPVKDQRTPDEILGYDEHGLPR